MTLLELPREVETGNIEYKWKLLNSGKDKIEKLASQLNWRLYEGSGVAVYYIGVKDDGRIEGLDKRDLNVSLKVILKAANIIRADYQITVNKLYGDKFYSSITFIRKEDDSLKRRDINNLGIGHLNLKSTGILS